MNESMDLDSLKSERQLHPIDDYKDLKPNDQ